jgi:hypothetical protein
LVGNGPRGQRGNGFDVSGPLAQGARHRLQPVAAVVMSRHDGLAFVTGDPVGDPALETKLG